MVRSAVLGAFCLYASSVLLAAAKPASIDTPAIDRIVEAALDSWRAPGAAVAIVLDGHIVHLKGYGVRQAGKPDPVAPRTRFALASLSKSFTAALISQLASEGKMSWDDPVSNYLPAFHLSTGVSPTLRDLGAHRTGLSRHDLLWYATDWSRPEILRRAAFLPLSTPFGKTWQYQNIMYMALGEAAAAATHSTWEDAVRARLLEPLAMYDTGFRASEAQQAPDHATPHALDDDGRPQPVPWHEAASAGGACSLYSNIYDLSRYVRMLLNGGSYKAVRVLSPEAIAAMHTPQIRIRPEDAGRTWNPDTKELSYGLGWFIQDYAGERLVSHGGAIDGFRSNITLLPGRRLGVIILTNLGGENMPEALRFSLVDNLLHRPGRNWNRILFEHSNGQGVGHRLEPQAQRRRSRLSPPTLPLAAYTGDFSDPAYGFASIRLTAVGLTLTWNGISTPLKHDYFDTFAAYETSPLENSQASFHVGKNGAVEGLTLFDVEWSRVHSLESSRK